MTTTPNINLILPDFNESPWHDDVNANFQAIDAIFKSTFGIENLLGAWVNSTLMNIGDRYYDVTDGFYYECEVGHTSAVLPTTFAADRLANPTYWAPLDASSAIQAVSDAQAVYADVLVSQGIVDADKGIVAADKAIIAADKATTQGYRDAALGYQTGAQAAQTAAEAVLDNFDDRYLGSKVANPALDNDGGALITGALYFNSVAGEMRVYNGAAWVAAYVPTAGLLVATNNLSDVANAATARTNLGLGNVDNTSDANKPVSTAQQTALNLKANLASPTFTGVPAGPTAAALTNTTQLATTAFVTTADNLKANLASPTFTGTPAAPTAAALTNTTQIATTAFVTTANNLKADLASPTFTGTPAAPTAAVGTNTTQLATTAFVQANGGKALKTIYTAGATWNKPAAANFLYAVVTVVAAGGGSGAIGTTSGTCTSGSGGGGGVSIKKILAASLGSTETVTVGTGGTAGATGGAGGTGGSSSFGAHATATGGAGGAGNAGTNGTYPASALGGVGSSGDLNFRGGAGENAASALVTAFTISGGCSGNGIPGGQAVGTTAASISSSAGQANSGGGASGCWRISGAAAFAGAAGGSGLVIVEEFYGS